MNTSTSPAPTKVQTAVQAIAHAVKQQQPRAVFTACRKALKQHPVLQQDPYVMVCLASALFDLGFYPQAAHYGHRVAALSPANSRAYFHIARTKLAQLKFADASEYINKAELLEPDFPENLVLRGHLHLLLGHYQEGWLGHEHRTRSLDYKARKFESIALWLGQAQQDIALKSIVVCDEGNAFDTLFFARFLPQLAQLGAIVTVMVHAPLVGLLKQMVRAYGTKGGRIEQVIAFEDTVVGKDYYAYLASLPMLLNVKTAQVGAYLNSSDASTHQNLGLPLTQSPQVLKVGLSWQVDPSSTGSITQGFLPALMKPLLATPNIQFYRLQGAGVQAPISSELEKFNVLDLPNPSHSWTVLSQQIGAMDMVVTVDNRVMQVAGALGKPMMVMLDSAAHWRHGHPKFEKHPFYPNCRVYRAPTRGRKMQAVTRLATDLNTWAKAALSQKNVPLTMSPVAQPIVETATLWSAGHTQLHRIGHGVIVSNPNDLFIQEQGGIVKAAHPQTVAAFEKLCSPTAVVVEVGAYIGLETMPYARHTAKGGVVFAFEAHKNNFDLLHTNITLNELTNVRLMRCVVSNQSTKVRLPSVNPRQSVNFAAKPLVMTGDQGEYIPSITLDSLGLKQLTLLRIDAPDMVEQVLEGSAQVIAAFKPMVCVTVQTSSQYPCLLKSMQSLGYQIYWQPAAVGGTVWCIPAALKLEPQVIHTLGWELMV